jgi:hypothetical protein
MNAKSYIAMDGGFIIGDRKKETLLFKNGITPDPINVPLLNYSVGNLYLGRVH